MNDRMTYEKRLDILRETKARQTQEKIDKKGRTLDLDDRGYHVAPDDFDFRPVSNHESGGFFGPRACSENYRRLLECHPVYIDPLSSLAGSWVAMMQDYREPLWNPDFDYSFLQEEHKKYGLIHGIGAVHHFIPDLDIGFRLGWKGILEKIRFYRESIGNYHMDFYDALENCVLGIQDFIQRHADAAQEAAGKEKDPVLKKNLENMAAVNRKLVSDPPSTFLEVLQWMTWFILVSNIYNGGGSAVGAIDKILEPYYSRDTAAGILDDEEAVFHIACLFLKDNVYSQIGGTDENGNDRTNKISFLVLEAINKLKIPNSTCLRVHEGLDPKLLNRAVNILFEDRTATPNFIGDKAQVEGFMKNGYPRKLAVERVKVGCHWCVIPGREYTLNDCVEVNFAAVFETALREMMSDDNIEPGVEELWRIFSKHLKRAVEVIAEGMDFHLEHMHQVYPELVIDLLCYGPIEKGLDATHGGVEFYNMCIDGAGLAVVADSFGALEQRIEKENRLTWKEMMEYLDNDYKDAEDIRLMLSNTPRYGSGGSLADEYAVRVSKTFTRFVKERPTPAGRNMIPGLFSWSNTIPLGKQVGATPNGRHAYAPISHGANPNPGFKEAGAMTAMATAIASVQCSYGNTVPIQLEVDPIMASTEEGIEKIESFIKAYCNDMGGTLMNINILNKEKILAAHKDPSLFPDLIVRVTGFSAYFAALSEKFRQLVVDRIIRG